MNKKPDFWKDQDEVSKARRARLNRELQQTIDFCLQKRPELKDLQQQYPPVDTPNKTSSINSTIPAGKVFPTAPLGDHFRPLLAHHRHQSHIERKVAAVQAAIESPQGQHRCADDADESGFGPANP